MSSILRRLHPDLYEKGNLNNLKSYSYNAVDKSYLSQVLNPYWEWVTTLMPKWLAPNAITLAGIIPTLFCLLATLYYSPNNKESLPSWLCFSFSICVFFQQTMDAVDGKQARRTKSGSIAGEIFDHGCDSIFAACYMSILSAILMRGEKSVTLFVIWYYFCGRFLPAWEKFYTGRFFLGVVNGAVEGLMLTMLLGIFGGVFGNQVYLVKVIGTLDLGDAICILGSLPGIFELFYAHSKAVIQSKKRNTSIHEMVLRLATVYPALLSAICVYAWISSPYSVALQYIYWMIIALCLLAAHIEILLGACHAFKEPYPHQAIIALMLPIFFAPILVNIPRFYPQYAGVVVLLEGKLIIAWCVLTAIRFLVYFAAIMDAVCGHLGIRCFSIRPIKARRIKSE